MNNPFAKSFGDFDVTKLIAEFKFPGVDFDTVVASQRKNIEALTKANQLAIEGFQAVGRRQAEILRSGFQEAGAAFRDMMQSSPPQAKVAKQTEAAKAAVEKAIANARELAEIVAKAQNEAFDVLNKRWSESVDEVSGLVAKVGKK